MLLVGGVLLVAFLGFWFYRRRSDSRPGSCAVLPERYCKKGEVLFGKNGKRVFLGFKVGRKMPVFAPFGGQLSRSPMFSARAVNPESDQAYTGMSVSVMEGEKHQVPEKSFSAVFVHSQEGAGGVQEVKKGEIIGRVSGEVMTDYGDYNLLVGFSEFDEETRMNRVSEGQFNHYFGQ